MSLFKEIASNVKQLDEGMVDPHLLMMMDDILNKKQVTNRFAYVMIAKLVEMLKHGDLYKRTNLNEVCTPAEIIAYIRAMPIDELMPLVTQLREMLFVKDQDLLNRCANSTQPLADWIRYVSKAND